MVVRMTRYLAAIGFAFFIAMNAARAGDQKLGADAFAVVEGAAESARGRDEDGAWLRFATAGPGDISAISSAAPLDPPLDLNHEFVRVRIRVDDRARLEWANVVLESRHGALVYPIPLFAEESFNILQDGEWLDLSLCLGSMRTIGTPDTAAIERVVWRLAELPEASDAGRVTAYWGGLEVVKRPPRGVVSITFDDGYDEHYDVAAPLLAKHGFRGTAYVMPDQIGQTGYMTLPELRRLRDRFGWDVAAHHFVPLTDFSPDALASTLANVQEYLSRNGFGDGAAHLAYPLGKYDTQTVLPLVRSRFATARLASAGPETIPPGDPHRLRVLNVLDSTSPAQIRAAVRRAGLDREWLILMFHFLVDEAQHETEYAIGDLEKVVAAIDEEGVSVQTVSEVWRGVVSKAIAPPRP